MTIFKVENNQEHKPEFYRYVNVDADPELYHLFEVHVFDPSNDTWFPAQYCLAGDMRGAVSQCLPYNIGSDLYDKSEEGSYAIRRPMKIRGWGKTNF